MVTESFRVFYSNREENPVLAVIDFVDENCLTNDDQILGLMADACSMCHPPTDQETYEEFCLSTARHMLDMPYSYVTPSFVSLVVHRFNISEPVLKEAIYDVASTWSNTNGEIQFYWFELVRESLRLLGFSPLFVLHPTILAWINLDLEQSKKRDERLKEIAKLLDTSPRKIRGAFRRIFGFSLPR